MDITPYIRTYVPIVVGWAIARLGAVLGPFEVDSAAISAVVTGVVIAVYYAVARELEQRYSWAGWLLGSRKQPTYE